MGSERFERTAVKVARFVRRRRVRGNPLLLFYRKANWTIYQLELATNVENIQHNILTQVITKFVLVFI